MKTLNVPPAPGTLLALTGDDDYDAGFNRTSTTVFCTLAGLFVATRFWRLGTYELWWDEVMSVRAARLSWNDLLSWAASEAVIPPLFYLLLKVWISIGGESLAWLKLFPALTSFAAIVPFFLFCRELRLRAAEVNLALGLMAVNSYLIHYAQEVRMYSLLFLLSACSLWLFARFVNEQRRKPSWGWLLVANLLLVYTHVFGWLVVLAQAVYVLLFGRSKLWSLGLNIAALTTGLAPWAWLVTQAQGAGSPPIGSNVAWLQRPDIIALAGYYNALHGPFENRTAAVMALVLFGIPILLWLRRVATDVQRKSLPLAGFLLLSAFVPVLTAFAASHLLPVSVFGVRYLIISAIPYLTLVSVALMRLPDRRTGVVLASFVLLWAVSSSLYRVSRTQQRFDWSEILHTTLAFEPSSSAKITLYAFEPFVTAPIEYYLESSGLRERFDIHLLESTAGLQGSRFWVAYRNTNERWKTEPIPAVALRKRNCQVGPEVTFGSSGQKIVLLHAQSCP